MGKKIKLDVKSTQAQARKTPTFRVAHTPANRSTPLMTTLRKGSQGRRGHRREQLPDLPQELPSDEIIPDTSLPDFDHQDELDDAMSPIIPEASKPKTKENSEQHNVCEYSLANISNL
jgi:hypothetical protein